MDDMYIMGGGIGDIAPGDGEALARLEGGAAYIATMDGGGGVPDTGVLPELELVVPGRRYGPDITYGGGAYIGPDTIMG